MRMGFKHTGTTGSGNPVGLVFEIDLGKLCAVQIGHSARHPGYGIVFYGWQHSERGRDGSKCMEWYWLPFVRRSIDGKLCRASFRPKVRPYRAA